MLALLLAHAAALAAWHLFTRYEIRENHRLIEANGAKDDLKDAFHARRTRLRMAAASGLLLAVAGALHWCGLPGRAVAASTAGLLGLLAGWFFYTFNPALSLLRGKPAYYVSFAPDAAWLPDRLLARRAVRAYPGRLALNDAELYAARRTHAATSLRTLLRVALGAGLAGEAAGLAVALL